MLPPYTLVPVKPLSKLHNSFKMDAQKQVSDLISETTVPASTLTPTNATTPRPQADANIRIVIPPAAAADDKELVTSITEIVNEVYIETESDLFVPGYKRTENSEVANFLRAGQLAVAYLDEDASSGTSSGEGSSDVRILPRQVVGCVCIKRLSPTLGEFGMLALNPTYRGGGLGTRMAEFAENHSREQGCSKMQLEILIPLTFHHAFKTRLLKWYIRMGYQLVKLGDFVEDYPAIAPLLAGPTEYRVFEKPLLGTE